MREALGVVSGFLVMFLLALATISWDTDYHVFVRFFNG